MPQKDIFSASSPGKFILLGEHSVVYGKPAVALAINRRFRCSVRKNPVNTLNGLPLDTGIHPHIGYILERNGVEGISIVTESGLPSSSGLGSSAALSSSLSAAIKAMKGESMDRTRIADEAFNAEYNALGRASPLDASCCTFGKGIAINCPESLGKEVWSVSKNGNTWNISEVKVPKMTFVIGYTGVKARTGPLVEKVRKYKEHNRFAADIVDEIGRITVDGMESMARGNVKELGDIMTKNHKLLSILGVSCNELNKLVNASLKYSYGAKLTGSGGGGSMVALTDEPEKVCNTILLHGGLPFVVETDVPGVTIE
ncbi:MAG: mevalonate kinase [Candidatus Methanomethylophilaceae archaeon]|nr:mevalonate kinase [Candidatus Methanomethylophilaceae archaeon]